MKKTYRYFILCLWLLAASVTAYGQGSERVLTDPIPGNTTPNEYFARDRVVFKPGAKFKPDNSTYTLKAYLDEHLTLPLVKRFTPANGNLRSTLNTSLEPGSTTANVSITPVGQVSCTLPIYAAPGTAGMQPAISIAYTPGNDAGLLGYGWDIAGISTISRVGRNQHFDNATEAVNYSNNDGFAIDGQRLLPVLGSNGADGALYGTESENFTQVISHGTSGNGPAWFEVKTKDGLTLEFGHTADSKLEGAPGSILYWKVSKITDANGNYMLFTYQHESDELAISRIDYTGNSGASIAPYNRIEFYYDRNHTTLVQYLSGRKLQHSFVLRQVKSFAENNLVKTYSFSYTTDLYTKLQSITESNAIGGSYNSMLVDWGSTVSSPTGPSGGTTASLIPLADDEILNDGQYKLYAPLARGDVDGDGVTEFIFYQGHGVDRFYVYYPQSGSYATIPYTFSNTTSVSMLDFDRDGRDEIYILGINGNNRFEFTGFVADANNPLNIISAASNTITSATFNRTNAPSETLTLVPVNHSGNTDDMPVIVLRSITQSSQPVQAIVDVLGSDPNVNYSALIPSSFQLDLLTVHKTMRFADMNADGRTDIIELRDNISTPSNTQMRIFSYSASSGQYELAYNFATLTGWQDFAELGDFNGDGNTDLLLHTAPDNHTDKSWQIAYATGSGFTALTSMDNLNELGALPGSVFLSDFDNDGKTDVFCIPEAWKLTLLKNKGGIFERQDYTVPGMNPGNTCYFNDMNGDGINDIYVQLNYVNTLGNETAGHKYYFIRFYNGEFGNHILHLTDGMNNVTSFTYNILTQNLHHAYTHDQWASNPAAQYRVVNSPLFQVSSMNRADETLTMAYSDAIADKNGKGFLGYRSVTKSTSWDNVSVTSTEQLNQEYNETYSFLYPVSQIRTVNGTETSRSEYTYSYASGYSGPRYWQQLTAQTDADILSGIRTETSYSYDAYGNLTTQTQSHTGGNQLTTWSNQYGTFGSFCDNKLTQQTVSYSKLTGSASPDNGTYVRTTTYDYDSKGNLTTMIQDPGTVQPLTTAYEYNAFGLATKQTVSASGVTSRMTRYTYDPQSRFVIKTINPLNQVTEATYEPRFGQQLTFTDIDLRGTSSTYNDWGRMVTATDKIGNVTTYTQAFDANTPGTYLATVTNPHIPTSKAWFNAKGQKVKTSAINASGTEVMVSYEYDQRGSLIKEYKPYSASTGPGAYILYGYEAYKRLYETTDPDGRHTIIDRYNPASPVSQNNDPYLITTTLVDPSNSSNNQVQQQRTNADGQLESTTDNAGSVSYEYYNHGQPMQITAAGAVSTFEYDGYFRKTQHNDPDAGLILYEYNALGELTKQTDARGIITTMQYDAGGRQTQKNVNNAGQTVATTYTYTLNRLTSASNPDVTQTFTYDGIGRLLSRAENISGQTLTTSYTYDQQGNIKTQTYPSGFAISKSYDAFGRLIAISNAATNAPIWQATTYNLRDQLTQATLNGNLKYTYAYDSRYMLTGTYLKNGRNIVTWNQQYLFDYRSGNLKWRKDMLKNPPAGLKEEYTYDRSDRLLNATLNGASQLDMSYSPNGNILTKSNVSAGSYEYQNLPPHAVSGINNLQITIPSFNQTAVYNAANRVTKLTYNTDEMSFTYGPDDERRKTEYKQNGQTASTKYFSGDYEKEITPTGTTETHYIYAPNGLAAMFIKSGTTQNLYYTCTDYLGSISALVNTVGGIVEEYNVDAWGTRRNPADWTYTAVPSPTLTSRCFTGHEHLDAFGVINMNARLYDPLVGRMLSPDPYVGDATASQHFNRYTYALNNPFKYTDPTGNTVVGGGGDGGVWQSGTLFEGYDPNLAIHEQEDFLATGGGSDAEGGGNFTFESEEDGGPGKGNPNEKKEGDKIVTNEGTLNIVFFKPLSDGVHIGLGFEGEQGEYHFFQTVGTNFPKDNKKSPYVDGNPYYTSDPYSSQLPGNYVKSMQDRPGRPADKTKFVVWKAELSVLKTTKSGNKALATLTYGYIIAPEKWGGAAYVIPLSITSPSRFHLQSMPKR